MVEPGINNAFASSFLWILMGERTYTKPVKFFVVSSHEVEETTKGDQ
jgi:hypothetical protein